MAESIIESIIRRVKELESEQFHVVINDYADEAHTWVNVSVHYSVFASPAKYQATFVIYHVSEHIWQIDVSNGSGCWQVVIEANPLAAFYMAAGFNHVNES